MSGANLDVRYSDCTPEKRYAAGPRWKEPGGKQRKEGDVIEEAGTFSHLPRLVSRGELVEIPQGRWEYRATRKYVGSNGEREGDVIEGIEDEKLLRRLLNTGHLTRVDVPVEKALEVPKKVQSRAQQLLAKETIVKSSSVKKKRSLNKD